PLTRELLLDCDALPRLDPLSAADARRGASLRLKHRNATERLRSHARLKRLQLPTHRTASD
ncbi:hypothetical protein SB757_30650, partial [Pseudomonas sp. SIMBA_065]